MLIGLSALANSGKDVTADFLRQDFGSVSVALADPIKRIAREIYAFTEEQLWGPSHMRNAPDKRYPRDHSYGPCPSTGGYATCACCGALSDGKTRQCYLTPRYVCQRIGTELGRDCYPDTWVALCVRVAKDLLGPYGHDLRYDRRQGIYRLPDHREWDEAERREAERARAVVVSDVRFRNEMRGIREAGGKIIRIKRPGAGLAGAAGLHPSEAEQASIPDAEFDAVIINDGTLEDLRARVSEIGRQYIPDTREGD